jgi:hypothetical protein
MVILTDVSKNHSVVIFRVSKSKNTATKGDRVDCLPLKVKEARYCLPLKVKKPRYCLPLKVKEPR